MPGNLHLIPDLLPLNQDQVVDVYHVDYDHNLLLLHGLDLYAQAHAVKTLQNLQTERVCDHRSAPLDDPAWCPSR